jgi:hypothetical protein
LKRCAEVRRYTSIIHSTNKKVISMMMKENQTYATVASDEEATGIEMIEEEHMNVPGRVVEPGAPQTTSRSRSTLFLLTTFLVGLSLGNLSSRNFAWSVPLVTSSSSSSSGSVKDEGSNNSSSEKCGDAATVSYGFLQTTRGTALDETLHDELLEQGPKVALEHIQLLMDEDDQVANSCHPLAHVLGRHALRELGFDAAWGGMVGTDDAPLLRICNAAYMHGIIEHYLLDSENLMDDVTMITDSICKELTNVDHGGWECHHGIGHGIIQHFRSIKDKETLTEAIDACKMTAFAADCENGLWMDHFASTRVSGMLEPSSLEVCSLAQSDSWACGIYSPTEFLLHYPRAYKEAVQFCQTGFANDTHHEHVCINGVGMQAAKENLHDYLPVEEACLTVPKGLQWAFFHEAIHYYTMSTGQSKIPPSLCENLVVFKDQCIGGW